MHNRGFTLIELMVAISIFTIVMMVAMGAVFSVVSANRKSQSINVVVNNLNFAFESMIRDMRTGSNYQVSNCDNTDECLTVSFRNREGKLVSYTQGEDEATGQLVILKTYPNDRSLPQGAITDPEITITSMSFNLKGEGTGDGQLLLRIHLQGEAGNQSTKSSFNIQTLISPRSLDSNDI